MGSDGRYILQSNYRVQGLNAYSQIAVKRYSTVKVASVVNVPPGVVTVIGPVMAPAGTVAHT